MHVIVDAFWQGRNKFPKKVIGTYFDDVKKPKACCHVGAIFYGTFKKTTNGVNDLIEMYPELRDIAPLPCNDIKDETEGWISSILVHLNDNHDKRDWPDAKVADWLESVLS